MELLKSTLMKILGLKSLSQKFPLYVNLEKSRVSSEKNYEDQPIDRILITDDQLGMATVDLSFKEKFVPRKDRFDPRMAGAVVYQRYNYVICEACYEKNIDCSNCHGQKASVQQVDDLVISGRDYKMLEKALGYSKGPESPEDGPEGFGPERFPRRPRR